MPTVDEAGCRALHLGLARAVGAGRHAEGRHREAQRGRGGGAGRSRRCASGSSISARKFRRASSRRRRRSPRTTRPRSRSGGRSSRRRTSRRSERRGQSGRGRCNRSSAPLRRCALLAGRQCASRRRAIPSRPIRILVGFPPGTAPDVTARIARRQVRAKLGQAGRGREHHRRQRQHRRRPRRQGAARRLHAADGRQLVADHEPQPVRQAAVRSGQGLSPISPRSSSPRTSWWCTDVPAKSIPELVALARAKPGDLTYGHTGLGTSQHLAGELFKVMAKRQHSAGAISRLDRGAARPARRASHHVVQQRRQRSLPLVREGKLRAFAVTLAQALGRGARAADHGRSWAFPASKPSAWFGLMAPAGTPQADHRQGAPGDREGAGAARRAQKFEDARPSAVIGSTPAEFAELIRTEIPHWAKIIKEAGIKLSE